MTGGVRSIEMELKSDDVEGLLENHHQNQSPSKPITKEFKQGEPSLVKGSQTTSGNSIQIELTESGIISKKASENGLSISELVFILKNNSGIHSHEWIGQ